MLAALCHAAHDPSTFTRPMLYNDMSFTPMRKACKKYPKDCNTFAMIMMYKYARYDVKDHQVISSCTQSLVLGPFDSLGISLHVLPALVGSAALIDSNLNQELHA